MAVTDTIGDMFTRIRNGLRAKHGNVNIPFSKAKAAIAEILKSEGFILYEIVVKMLLRKQSVFN